MRKLIPALLATTILAIGMPESISAQIVRFGGGVSVRAPFVRVEVGPNGETWVRAPFTDVYSPGHPYFVPGRVAPGRVVPGGVIEGTPLGAPPVASASPANMTWLELRKNIRDSASRLNRDLGASRERMGFRKALRPGTIRDLVSDDVDQPPDVETAEQLAMLVATFDAVRADPDAANVSSLESFVRLTEGLHEFLAPPVMRQRRQLANSGAALGQSLMRYNTGPDWQEYLLLSDDLFAGPGDSVLNGPITEADVQHATKILKRFDKAAGDAQYQSVTKLSDFRAVHNNLSVYVAMLGDPPRQASVEELPAPDKND